MPQKTKKKKLDQPAEGVHARLRRSVIDLLSLGRCRSLSKSVVFGLCLASLKKLFTMDEVCLFFFRLSRAERNFPQGRWRPRGNALSMAHQLSVGRACGWLVSAVFRSWVEKNSDFPDRFRNEKWNTRAKRFARTCNIFRVSGVIVRMPYLPSWKVRWDNSIYYLKNENQHLLFLSKRFPAGHPVLLGSFWGLTTKIDRSLMISASCRSNKVKILTASHRPREPSLSPAALQLHGRQLG